MKVCKLWVSSFKNAVNPYVMKMGEAMELFRTYGDWQSVWGVASSAHKCCVLHCLISFQPWNNLAEITDGSKRLQCFPVNTVCALAGMKWLLKQRQLIHSYYHASAFISIQLVYN